MGAHKGFRFWALAPVQSPFHTSSCSAGGSYCMYFYLVYTYINKYIRIARVKLQHAPTNQAPHHPLDGWMAVMTRLWWMKNLNSELITPGFTMVTHSMSKKK
jgi:hypothetical protein